LVFARHYIWISWLFLLKIQERIVISHWHSFA